ncbi:hypothetical protein ACU6VI_08620 [Sphaerotilus natans]|uniref:hypothetical protein n=1 Tax=Sphaerotilus natans TaxID=34103 RepID=UPI00406C444C
MHIGKALLWGPLLLSAACWADTPGGGSAPSGTPPQASAEMKAAFEACKAQGKPGDSAFESCMSSKGFKRPEGKPPGGA